jgi:pimeloyl-ACP methyl ester carboxylesterase
MDRTRSRAFSAPAAASPALLGRLAKAVLALAGVLFLVLIGIGGFLTYRILTTRNDVENVTPASYLLTNFVAMDFTDASGAKHAGWMLYGLRGAPAIILCPGYNSNRAELLSLATVLQQNHFNVYLFNFEGVSSGQSYSNLGVREAAVVAAAIQMVTKQPGINQHRVGVFGTTTGAFGALAAAEADARVEALAVDNVYEKPVQMFDAELDQLLGGPGALFRILAETEFRLFTLGAKSPPVLQNLSKLADRHVLFLAGADVPRLSTATQDLYKSAPQSKRILLMDHAQTSLASGAERKEYENQVLSFFLQSLPLRAD